MVKRRMNCQSDHSIGIFNKTLTLSYEENKLQKFDMLKTGGIEGNVILIISNLTNNNLELLFN